MKLKKSDVRKIVRETIYEELSNVAKEQRNLVEYINLYVKETPFLHEYKNIKSKKALLEFFGPFKKLSSADLSKMGKEKDVKNLLTLAKDAEKARKNLSSLKLTNTNAIEVGLESYTEKLIDLYQSMKGADVDEALKAQLAKPFASAAQTLQGLSASLADAANDLFTSVPRSSGLYNVGQQANELEADQAKFMMKPGEVVKKAAKDAWSGIGGVPGGRDRGPKK